MGRGSKRAHRSSLPAQVSGRMSSRRGMGAAAGAAGGLQIGMQLTIGARCRPYSVEEVRHG